MEDDGKSTLLQANRNEKADCKENSKETTQFVNDATETRNVEENISVTPSNQNGVQLEKTISLISSICLVVGSIIGSGIFLSPSGLLDSTKSIGLYLVLWILCGVFALLGSLCYVELGTEIQRSGAEYAYLYEAFGDIPAFLYSWTGVIAIRTSATAAISLTFAEYVVKPFYEDVPTYVVKLMAFVCIVLITCVNCISVKMAVFVQNIFTAAKLIAVFIIIVIGCIHFGKGNVSNFENPFEGTEENIFTISRGFYLGLWAYDGWNTLNFVTEEMQNPSRDMPRTLIISMVIVITCYLLCNVSYIAVLGAARISLSRTVALDVANEYLGKAGFIMPILVGLSCFGAVNGLAFSSGRLVYAAARERHLPKVLSLVQVNRHTPIPSLLFNAIISILMLIPDSSKFDKLIGIFSIASWLFYGACFVVLIFLRWKRKTMTRPYKVFLPIPIFMVIASIFLTVFPFYEDWEGSLVALTIILLGIPVYFVFVKLDILKYFPMACQDCMGTSIEKTQSALGLGFPKDESSINA